MSTRAMYSNLDEESMAAFSHICTELALQHYEPSSMHNHQLDVVWEKAINDLVTDIYGKKYIDFTSGIFVTNCGHSNPYVQYCIKKQIDSNLNYTYTFRNSTRAHALEHLHGFLPAFCEQTFMMSSGSETADCAVKLMQRYSRRKRPVPGHCIISVAGGMHGKTMVGELLKGYNEESGWCPHGIHSFSPITDKLKIRDLCLYSPAGIIIESYTGWNAKFHDKVFIKELVEYAKEHDVPVCFDEIQAGFGRTGKDFGYLHYNVEPDLLMLGKAMGNGFPVSAVTGRKKYFDTSNDLSSTYSGNPLACAAVIGVVREYKGKIKPELDNISKIFKKELDKISNQYYNELNCTGMVAGIVFKDAQTASKVANECMCRGLLVVKTGRESVKLGPPLTISEANLVIGVTILKDVIQDVLEEKNEKR